MALLTSARFADGRSTALPGRADDGSRTFVGSELDRADPAFGPVPYGTVRGSVHRSVQEPSAAVEGLVRTVIPVRASDGDRPDPSPIIERPSGFDRRFDTTRIPSLRGVGWLPG